MVSVQCNDGSEILGVLKDANSDRILLELYSGKKGGKPEQRQMAVNEIKSTRIHIQL